MSLESLIEENTKAVRELTAALSALAGAQTAIGTAKATSGNSKPAATPSAPTPSTAAATGTSAPPRPSVATSVEPVDYDAVKTPFLALWKKDAAKANAVLAEYGVNNLKLVPAEKLAEVKVKVEAALA
mgnify:CR=1 FL=1